LCWPAGAKKKVGVEQGKISEVIWANAWFDPPSDPFANETSNTTTLQALRTPFRQLVFVGFISDPG
jgi:hypothetical protein